MDFTKFISLLLSLLMLLGTVAPAIPGVGSETVYPATDLTVEQATQLILDSGKDSYDVSLHTPCDGTCNGDCAYSPVIIVPGIMQSQVYVQDADGNDILTVDGFPIVEGMDMQFMIDTKKLENELVELVPAFMLACAGQDRNIFLDKLVEVLDESVKDHYFNPDGTRVNNVQVDEYWYSLEVAKTVPDKSYNYAKGYKTDADGNTLPSTKYPTQYDFIQRQVDITNYCEIAGYDHAYYYAYSSFGDTLDAAARLNDYVQMVKEQTGHSKVSMVFISLGGTIGNVYLSEYCNPADIDRVVYAAAAADGSSLLSDLMDANFTFDDPELLYSDMLPRLIDMVAEEYTWLAYLGNYLLRAVPEEVFADLLNDALTRVVNEVLNNIIANCPSTWALVPSEVYPTLSEKLISDDAHAALKIKTDEYYDIQRNAKQNLKTLSENGMDIFVISGYNLTLPTLLGSCNQSSDNIIQTASTSLGAVVADYGETLPTDYIPAIDESYLSPGRELDAGAAALPDRTWFIYNQSHLNLQSSVKDVISLCIEIAVNPAITDARVNNGGYAQFNNYRNLSGLQNYMNKYRVLTAETLNASGASAAQLNELYNAYENAKSVYNSLDWNAEVAEAAEKRLYTVMLDTGFAGEDTAPEIKYTLSDYALVLLGGLNDATVQYAGAQDYYSY